MIFRYSLLRAFCLSAGLVALSALPAAAQFLTIGNTGGFNGFPFGAGVYTGEYQQIYSSAAFTGVVTINSVAFSSSSIGGAPGTANYALDIGLSTTAASVASPGTTFASNKGPGFATVFSGNETATFAANDTFDLVFPITPFTYNPVNGNLLLDVVVSSSSGDFEAFNSGISPDVSRVFNGNGGSIGTADSEALVTRFGVATPVPEPTGLLMCLALATTSIALARRRLRT
jgi:hypothetical protein